LLLGSGSGEQLRFIRAQTANFDGVTVAQTSIRAYLAPEIRAVFRTRRQSPDAENAWLGREDSNSRKRGEVRSMSPEQKETSPWSNAQAGRILTCFTAAAFLANPPPGWARLPKERQFRGRANRTGQAHRLPRHVSMRSSGDAKPFASKYRAAANSGSRLSPITSPR
jgi:hypothetical protein